MKLLLQIRLYLLSKNQFYELKVKTNGVGFNNYVIKVKSNVQDFGNQVIKV